MIRCYARILQSAYGGAVGLFAGRPGASEVIEQGAQAPFFIGTGLSATRIYNLVVIGAQIQILFSIHIDIEFEL